MTMRWLTGICIAIAGLGFWAGFSSWGNASALMRFNSGIAILMAANVILMSWVWFRAKPGSGDAIFLPDVIQFSASMLVGLVPRLLGAPDNVQIAGSILSAILAVLIGVRSIRRSRKLRAARQ